MVDVIARAVADRQRVPAAPVEIRVDGQTYVLEPRACERARSRARRQPLPHNRARRVFVDAMLTNLTRQVDGTRFMRPEDLADFRAELAAEPAIQQTLDALWPELTPEQLLADLYTSPERLLAAAPDFTEDERSALSRLEPATWTPADIPLLDEAAELLGELDATRATVAARRSRKAAEQAVAARYAQEVIEKLRVDDAIKVEQDEIAGMATFIAGGNAVDGLDGTLAERALGNREWTYGHVVVDEAQELSAMAWRLLARRCPARSMTVVGDLAQASSPGAARAWSEVLDPVAAGRWRSARLRLNYRTPQPVMAVATAVLEAADPSAEPPVPVRDSDEHPWLVLTDAAGLPELLVDAVQRELAVIGAGQLAVIAPDRLIATVLPRATGPVLDASVAVLTAVQAKGLEFDAVVVVDPAGMIPADLYVALTRTTRRLGVIAVDRVPLPLATMG